MDEPKENQRHPESQKEPFGPKQLAWLDKKYGCANFRTAGDSRMIKVERHD